MSLNESIVEDAALEWFGELGYAVGHGAAFAGLRRAKPPLAPVKPAAEWEPERSGDSRRQSFGEVVLVGRLREAIRLLNPAIPEGARATVRQYRRVQISTGRETMP
ncbi:MAG: hypothetical protein RLZZ179_639 [Verrucomicrobiota bacterium]|jgi:type I restriction enzyme R subunit